MILYTPAPHTPASSAGSLLASKSKQRPSEFVDLTKPCKLTHYRRVGQAYPEAMGVNVAEKSEAEDSNFCRCTSTPGAGFPIDESRTVYSVQFLLYIGEMDVVPWHVMGDFMVVVGG